MHATVDAAAVRRHFQSLAAAGVPRAVLAAALGVDPARLDERDGRISCQANLRLLETGTAALGRGSALRLGAAAAPHELGACGFLVAASATLEEALDHFLRYQRLVHGLSRFAFTRTRHGAVLRHELSPAISVALQPVIAELNLAAVVAVARRLAGRSLHPTAVRFRHRCQAEPADYQRAFGGVVSFGQRDDALVWSGAQLATPIPGAAPYLRGLLAAHADQLVRALPPSAGSFRDQVVGLLHGLLPRGRADIEHVARELGVSRWTVARRLHRDGTSFERLTQELRERLARDYLADPALSIAEISLLLGYSETSAFRRAFRAWTGASPIAHRKRS